MKLLSLHLKAFRQHRETSLAFEDGLTGIIGPNGAGKTSLVEAIAFALFGTRAIRGKIEELRSRGARNDELPTVSLFFEHEGTSYRVERDTRDASLYVGGDAQAIISGNRDVSVRVEQLLSMTHEEFLATFFTEQKGLEFLSGKKGAAERERFIVRMMGYDKLEKAQELLRAEKRDRKAEVSGLEAALGDRDSLCAQIRIEEAEIAELLTKISEVERAITEGEQEGGNLKKRFEALAGLRVDFVSQTQSAMELSVRITEKSSRLKEVEYERKRLGELRFESVSLSELSEEHRSKLIADLNANLTAASLALEENLAHLQREESSWKEQVATLRARQADLLKRGEELDGRWAKFSHLGAGGDCPTCGQALGSAFEQVKHEAEHQRSTHLRESEKFARALLELKNAPPSVQAARTGVEERQRAKQVLVGRLENLSKLEKELHLLSRIDGERQQLETTIAGLHGQLATRQAALQALHFSEEDFNRLKAAYEANEKLRNISRLNKVKLDGEINGKKALLSRSREELRRRDEKGEALKAGKKQLLFLEESDRFLTDFRKYLNASIRPRLAELASEFLTDLTDGRYSSVDIDVDFSPTVMEDGVAKAVISGGEEDILNLCVRLALSTLLAERAGQAISLLILDEVFGSLDEGRRVNVLALLEKLGNRFEQIFVITHLDDVKDGLRNIVYVDYDEGTGTSQLAGVEWDGELVSNI